MTIYRRVVVGTDGSDSARRAVEHAAWLAGRLDADLVVSHAFRDPPEERGASREVGASLLRDAHVGLTEVEPIPVLREGDPADILLELAMEEAPGLVVVGNRGLVPGPGSRATAPSRGPGGERPHRRRP